MRVIVFKCDICHQTIREATELREKYPIPKCCGEYMKVISTGEGVGPAIKGLPGTRVI